MNKRNRYFRLQAILEVPVWVLIVMVICVTVAVFASALVTL